MNVLHSLNEIIERSGDGGSLDVHVCGADVSVCAPGFVVDILERVLAGVPRARGASDGRHTVRVDISSGTWQIAGATGNRTVLSTHCEVPRLVGAIVSTIVQDVAARSALLTLRGTIIEKDGRGLAIVGDDWESGLTVATHLHARGWHYVSGDHALIDRATFRAVGFEKSLYATASAAWSFPLPYRRAVEASPWYVSSNEIAFYAVDPLLVDKQAWSHEAVLDAFLVVDGATDERAALQTVPGMHVTNGPGRVTVDFSPLEGARMTLGPIIETCDLVERWFDAVPGRVRA